MQDLASQGFRLSPQQTNLWSLQQAAAGQSYRVVCAVAIEGKLELSELKKALLTVVRRHEILRTTFHRPPGIKTAFQVVSEEGEFSWQTFDLSKLDAETQDAEVERCFASERETPFEFDRGPLLRAALTKLSERRCALIISLPAISADSITVSSLVGELSRAYESRLNGQEADGEPMQYADFAEWQNELLESEDEHAAEGRAHWKRQASAPALPLVLPLEHRTKKSAAFQPHSVPVVVDVDLLRKIKPVAPELETSISSLLFACWQALIWRLTGHSDFVIFNLCDGRKFEDLKDALGLYAKYLPVQAHCEDVSFAEHAKSVREAIDGAVEWQEYFDPADSPSSHDGIAFEFEERPVRFISNDLSFSILKQYSCIQPFKLKLYCAQSGDDIVIELQYDARLLDRETVERFAGYFERLLSGVAQTSACDSFQKDQSRKRQSQTEVCVTPSTIGAIDILSNDERQLLLVDLNQTGAEYPSDKCIHQLFEEQAARTPDSLAVVFADQELTYGQLNARANQVAHLLRLRSVEPNDRVGLCTDRGAMMIVGLLGILKAGGAYVPLNPEHPRARLELQLKESNASILITASAAIDTQLDFAGEIIDLERDFALLEGEPASNPQSVATPDNLVYVIYTSGSTGVPKGVGVRHRSLVNYTHFILRSLQIDRPLHFATVSTIAADLGNTAIFPSLASGGCLHVLSYDVSMEGQRFRDYLAKRQIDVLKIVPSHLNALLSAQDDGHVLPSRYLILGGEALLWELIERISGGEHSSEIINHYGPTETTVGSLTFAVNRRDASSLTVPVGRPIANTTVYILDQRLNPAPVGVAGELYIGGAGVADGYLNQPAETAERFVPNPFSHESGVRLYRTGDLTRYLPDGQIEFLGRVDTQVKVRGFRVELGEIEALLAEHSGVHQAIAMVRQDASNDQRLIAYVVAPGPRPPTQDQLRSLLKQKLPDYMVPSAFVFLKSLPLTPNGKVDRAALPAPDEARPELQRTFIAPRTPIEKETAAIWATVLKLNEVGINDNFFDLGGHSLLATQVISRLRKAFQLEIPLRSLFESPTVVELAESIERATQSETEKLLAELEVLSDDEAARLLELENTQPSKLDS